MTAMNQQALRLFGALMVRKTLQKDLQLGISQIVKISLHQTRRIEIMLFRIGDVLDFLLSGNRNCQQHHNHGTAKNLDS
jgi:hypothetical protein